MHTWASCIRAPLLHLQVLYQQPVAHSAVTAPPALSVGGPVGAWHSATHAPSSSMPGGGQSGAGGAAEAQLAHPRWAVGAPDGLLSGPAASGAGSGAERLLPMGLVCLLDTEVRACMAHMLRGWAMGQTTHVSTNLAALAETDAGPWRSAVQGALCRQSMIGHSALHFVAVRVPHHCS